MSIRIMTWALDHAPVTDSTQAFVLLCLADYANDDTGICWPSIARIAARARCSESTARRAIRKLEDAGLVIRHGGKNGHGTNRYQIVMTPRQSDTPSNPTGVTDVQPAGTGVVHNPCQSARGSARTPVNVTPAPVAGDRGPLAPVTPEPSLIPQEPPAAAAAPLRELEAAARAAGLSARFDRLSDIERATVDVLIDIHGTTALIAAARSQHNPNDPARFVSAWIPAWRAMPNPARAHVAIAHKPGCDRCVHGWLDDDDQGRAVRCPACRPATQHAVL